MLFRLRVADTFEDTNRLRVLEWHGAAGDRFAAGDLVVELETHKAVVEIRAGQDGVLLQCRVGEGDWIEPGAVLALFGDSADQPLPTDETDITTDLLAEFSIG